MKRKNRLVSILLVILLLSYFSVSMVALDPISSALGLVGKSAPQPVFSIMDGLEKVKTANAIDQLSILNDSLAEEKEQKMYQIDQVRLISILLGNTNILRRIERTGEKIEDMTLGDWIDISGTDIIRLIQGMTGNIIVESTKAQPDDKQKKDIANMIAVSAGINRKDAKVIIDKIDEVIIKNKVEEQYLQKLASETSTPVINEKGELVGQEIENSTPAFIEEKQTQLKAISDDLLQQEITGDTSLMKQMKINNQLQMLNAQINLKILNSLNLVNEGEYVELISTRRERLERELESIGGM